MTKPHKTPQTTTATVYPAPLVDLNAKKPKTGNGNATLRTATAAAKAAEAARDEARKAARETAGLRDEAWFCRRGCEQSVVDADAVCRRASAWAKIALAANAALVLLHLLLS